MITIKQIESPAVVTDGVTNVNLYAGQTYTCEVPEPKSGIAYQRPQFTGQIVSYAVGDDYSNRINKPYSVTPSNPEKVAYLTDFNTLGSLNAFGTNERFTDENGLQVYGIGYIVDHLTGLGWSNAIFVGDWLGGISNATTSTLGGFTDWKLPNFKESNSIFNYNTSKGLNYAPFNIDHSGIQTTSTTFMNPTTYAVTMNPINLTSSFVLKTDTGSRNMQCRNHY